MTYLTTLVKFLYKKKKQIEKLQEKHKKINISECYSNNHCHGTREYDTLKNSFVNEAVSCCLPRRTQSKQAGWVGGWMDIQICLFSNVFLEVSLSGQRCRLLVIVSSGICFREVMSSVTSSVKLSHCVLRGRQQETSSFTLADGGLCEKSRRF